MRFDLHLQLLRSTKDSLLCDVSILGTTACVHIGVCRGLISANSITAICCGFVVEQLVINKTSTCCVDHKSDDMSRCCNFVVHLSFCYGFVLQLVVQQIHHKSK